MRGGLIGGERSPYAIEIVGSPTRRRAFQISLASKAMVHGASAMPLLDRVEWSVTRGGGAAAGPARAGEFDRSRDAGGHVEVHIEQGPCCSTRDAPSVW